MEYTGTQNQAAEPLFDYPMDSPSPLAPIADADADLPAAPEQGLAPSLERLRLQFYLVQVVVDVAILLGSFAVANLAYSASVLSHETMLAAYLLLPLFQTIAFYNSTYSRSGLTNWRAAGGRALAALLISAALLNFIAFFAKMNADFSRVVFTGGLVACGLAMIGFRWIFARYLMRKWGHSPVNRLLIEAGGPDVAFADVHRVDAEAHGLTPDIEDPDALDRLAKYLRNMDQVIVSCRPHERTAWASVLKGSGIHGEVVSGYAREIGAMGIVHHAAEDVYTILISRGHLGLRARAAKRLFDIAVSLAGLVLLAPVMLLTAMAIKLGDGGPVLFSQKRMGRGNRFFTIHKFRTMHAASGDATGFSDPQTELIRRALLASPEGREAIAERLAQGGHWDRHFLSSAASHASVFDMADLIMRAQAHGVDVPCPIVRGTAEALRPDHPALVRQIWPAECAD